MERAGTQPRGATRNRGGSRIRPETGAEIGSAVARIASEVAGGEPFVRLLRDRLQAVAGEAERERQVLEAILPSVDVLALSNAATTQLLLNARARAEALAEFGALTAGQLAEIRGVDTPNPHSTVSRWLDADRVFAVNSGQGRLFPGFQFENGRPRTVIARVLAALGDELDGWELLLWFTGSSGHLDGARPVDLLTTQPDAVVAAAEYQASLSED